MRQVKKQRRSGYRTRSVQVGRWAGKKEVTRKRKKEDKNALPTQVLPVKMRKLFLRANRSTERYKRNEREGGEEEGRMDNDKIRYDLTRPTRTKHDEPK